MSSGCVTSFDSPSEWTLSAGLRDIERDVASEALLCA